MLIIPSEVSQLQFRLLGLIRAVNDREQERPAVWEPDAVLRGHRPDLVLPAAAPPVSLRGSSAQQQQPPCSDEPRPDEQRLSGFCGNISFLCKVTITDLFPSFRSDTAPEITDLFQAPGIGRCFLLLLLLLCDYCVGIEIRIWILCASFAPFLLSLLFLPWLLTTQGILC